MHGRQSKHLSDMKSAVNVDVKVKANAKANAKAIAIANDKIDTKYATKTHAMILAYAAYDASVAADDAAYKASKQADKKAKRDAWLERKKGGTDMEKWNLSMRYETSKGFTKGRSKSQMSDYDESIRSLRKDRISWGKAESRYHRFRKLPNIDDHSLVMTYFRKEGQQYKADNLDF